MIKEYNIVLLDKYYRIFHNISIIIQVQILETWLNALNRNVFFLYWSKLEIKIAYIIIYYNVLFNFIIIILIRNIIFINFFFVIKVQNFNFCFSITR